MSALDEHLARSQAARARRGTERRLARWCDGMVDLAGNDYLGLRHHPAVVTAARDALERYGTTSAGSRVVAGNLPPHAALDEALAALLGTSACVSTASGYAANLAALTTLVSPGGCVVLDADAHASLVDGARLSGATVLWAQHDDPADVARLLARHGRAGSVVAVESLYSARGDAADLRTMHEVCRAADATLVVDEAHGLGVLGDGHGGVAAAGLAGAEGVVVTGALGKACAAQGGFIAGSADLVTHLVTSARSLIYDTALAPASAAAARAAVEIILTEPHRIARLHQHAAQLAAALHQEAPPGAIISVALAADEAATVLDRASAAGVAVGLFRPGSTPDGSFRLRLTAHADLGEEAMATATSFLNTVHPA